MKSNNTIANIPYPNMRLIFPLLLHLLLFTCAYACQLDQDCKEGVCRDGICENPFSKGCLQTLARRNLDAKHYNFRVCNSADGKDSNDCIPPNFEYEEVRIAPGNWESSILVAWIYQIILSEIYGVPTTIEMGDGKSGHHGSFYDPDNRFLYPSQVYPIDALIEASKYDGVCSATSKPCAHILPEVWDGGNIAGVKEARDQGHLLNIESNGIIGGMGYYIPAYTADVHPSFASFYGLRGDGKRAELAREFKIPTTWKMYCELFPLDCATGERVAKRYPNGTDEENSYFVRHLYDGHFRLPDNIETCEQDGDCIGHVVGPHCSWTTYVENQMFYNDIHLSSKGPVEPNNGYSYSSMIEIWKAANATKSHVFLWWWTPDLLLEEFAESQEFSFHRVTLPSPTEECLNYRSDVLNELKCSADANDRKGEAIGSCDYAVIPLRKLISAGLRTSSVAGGEIALESPAYTFLKQIYLTEYSLSHIFRKITKFDGDRTDLAFRESLCEWVYENVNELTSYAPKGFPRDKKFMSYAPIEYTGYTLGTIALILSVTTAICTFIWRDNAAIKSAQLNVLSSMVVGYVIASISSLLHALVFTSDALCTLQEWTLHLAYSLELVPILIKVSAINRLGREARLFRRAQIDPNRFRKFLSSSLAIILVYLMHWTLFDKPKRDDDLEVLEEGETTTVAIYAGCSSSSPVWAIMALSWESVILLSSTILAYQSREVIKQLSESKWLTFLVYSHSMFLIVRLVVQILFFSKMILSSLTSKITSITLSLETICAILIYFLPKFLIAYRKEEVHTIQYQAHRTSMNPSYARNTHHSSSNQRRHIVRRSCFKTSVNVPTSGVPHVIRGSLSASGNIDVSALRSRVSESTNASNQKNQTVKSRNSVVSMPRPQSILESSIYMGESDEEEEMGDIESLLNKKSINNCQLSNLKETSPSKEETIKNKKDEKLDPLVSKSEIVLLKKTIEQLQKENQDMKKKLSTGRKVSFNRGDEGSNANT